MRTILRFPDGNIRLRGRPSGVSGLPRRPVLTCLPPHGVHSNANPEKSRAARRHDARRGGGRLRHLPGLVFFDTAGNLASSAGRPVSVIAARPDTDPARLDPRGGGPCRLRAALADRPRRCRATTDFRSAACAAGWTTRADFVFGDYPEMLVFDHTNHAWWETGRLSECLRKTLDRDRRRSALSRPRPRREAFLRGRRTHQGMDRRRRYLSGESLASLRGGGFRRLAVRALSKRCATPHPRRWPPGCRWTGGKFSAPRRRRS